MKISVNCKRSRSAMTPTGPDSKTSSRQQERLFMQAFHSVNPKIVSDCVFVLFFSHFLFIVSVMNMLSVISDKAARRRNKKEKVLVCVSVYNARTAERSTIQHSTAQHSTNSAPHGTAQHNSAPHQSSTCSDTLKQMTEQFENTQTQLVDQVQVIHFAKVHCFFSLPLPLFQTMNHYLRLL